MNETSLPLIEPLHEMRSISPSRFGAMRECSLREVLASNRKAPLLPQGPAARLGSVIHRLLEEAGKGEFPPADLTAIDLRWNALVRDAELAMKSNWLERHLIPLSSSVADFEVRRLQARTRANELSRTAEEFNAAGAPTAVHFGCEIPVSSPDQKIRGQIDAVIPSDDGPVLKDYKSGNIFDPEGTGSAILKPAYETQLRMYAALYEMTFGLWPARLEIVPVLGDPQPVSFEPATCLALIDEAREVLSRVNTLVNSTAESGLIWQSLASPGPETCIHCSYRPSCVAYRRWAEQTDSVERRPHDIWGTLDNVRLLGNGQLLMTIQTRMGVVQIRGLTPGQRHPWLESLTPGDQLAAFNLRPTGSDHSFAESRFTVIYKSEDS